MIKNVCKALRRIFSCEEGDCIDKSVTSPQGASDGLECFFKNNIIIPEGVSEPVSSFVKCFKENPKRFSLTDLYSTQSYRTPYADYRLTDKVKKLKYVGRVYGLWVSTGKGLRHKGWVESVVCEEGKLNLTKEEGMFLYKVLREVFTERQNRYDKLLSNRRNRPQKLLREKLTKIYKGDDNV